MAIREGLFYAFTEAAGRPVLAVVLQPAQQGLESTGARQRGGIALPGLGQHARDVGFAVRRQMVEEVGFL